MKLEELQERLTRLKALVDEPQESQMSWCMLLGEQMNGLCREWNHGFVPGCPSTDERRRIFVFGSNVQGIHGKGAALTAYKHWGAQRYNGYGIQGNAYSIPTREMLLNGSLRTLPLEDVSFYVNVFLGFAEQHMDWLFLLTRIGCGYAGFEDAQIAAMFAAAPDNCQFDPAWALFDLKSWEESPDEYIRNRSARGSEVPA